MKLSDSAYVLVREAGDFYVDCCGEHYAREQHVWHPDDVVSYDGQHWRYARTGRFCRMDRSVRIV
jgi:hypothetical protein